MSEQWYEIVAADSTLTQGDLIFDCPLLEWKSSDQMSSAHSATLDALKNGIEVSDGDVIVMTQACERGHDPN